VYEALDAVASSLSNGAVSPSVIADTIDILKDASKV
jgi:hypothetical protein